MTTNNLAASGADTEFDWTGARVIAGRLVVALMYSGGFSRILLEAAGMYESLRLLTSSNSNRGLLTMSLLFASSAAAYLFQTFRKKL